MPYPSLLHPEPLTLWPNCPVPPQDMLKHSLSQWGPWALVHTRFVWALWASLVGMGFDSKHEWGGYTYYVSNRLLGEGILIELWMIGRILISKMNEGVQEVHSMRRKEQDKGTERVHWVFQRRRQTFQGKDMWSKVIFYGTELSRCILLLPGPVCQREAGSDPNQFLACLDHELVKFPTLPFMSSILI